MAILDRNRTSMYGFILSAALAAVQPLPAFAEEPHQFEIASLDPARAIHEFGTQSGVQILASAEQLAGKQLNEVTGTLSTDAGLKQLLAGTGLTHRYVGERTVALVQADAESERRATQGETSAVQRASDSVRIAQADASSREEEESKAHSSRDREKDVMELEEIVVTGTHIRGSQAAGSKVIVIDREDIDRSGYGRVQDLLETLPQNFASISEDFSGPSNPTRGTEIQLRGLGPGTTLTLINGHRQPTGGTLSAFVDISSIPSSAIERIEILPDGASAIYGSDAIGGVVNIILRKDYEGAETRVRLGSAQGGKDEVEVAQLVGSSWASGNALVGYQYTKQDPLFFDSRDYLATGGDQRRFGGSDWRRRGGNPGHILCPATGSFGCTPNQPAYAIPSGQDGSNLTAAELIPGQINYFDTSGVMMLPEQEIHSAFVSASQSLGERVDLDAGVRYAERDSTANSPASVATVSVPASNPFYVNPFGGTAPVRVEYDFAKDLGGLPTDVGHTETFVANVGGVLRIGQDWKLALSGVYGKESVAHERINLRNTDATTLALADSNPATALNVFSDGSHTNPETLARLRLSRFSDATTTIRSTGLIADGPLFQLAGGPARIALGLDHRNDQFDLITNWEISRPGNAVSRPRNERSVSAAFAELALPLLAAHASAPAIPKLELSLAGRFDDYDDVGSTFNPRVGLSWSPFTALKVRGTWGTSFRAPPFYLSDEDIRLPSAGTTLLADPTSPTGQTLALLPRGVSPDLKEETAEVWAAGLEITPIDDLSVSLTYFDITYEDKIQTPAPIASILVFESHYEGTGVIRRNPTQAEVDAICSRPTSSCSGGPVGAIVDTRMRNLASVEVDGLDLEIEHTRQSRLGAFRFGLAGTYTFSYKEAVTKNSPTSDFIDMLERPLALRLRGNVGWSLGGWYVNAAVNHSGSYRNPSTPASSKVDAWTVVDVGGGYEFGSNAGWSSDVRIAVNATNVFDEMPPFVDSFVGHDTANANLIGRVVSVQAVKKW